MDKIIFESNNVIEANSVMREVKLQLHSVPHRNQRIPSLFQGKVDLSSEKSLKTEGLYYQNSEMADKSF